MLARTFLVMRIRPVPARLLASCRVLNRAAEPGMATLTNRSRPRTLAHFLELMRETPFSSSKRSARAFLRDAGSSMVCRIVSMIQPRISFRVAQLPSP